MNRAGVAGHPLRYELGAWLFVAVVGLALFGAFVARLPMWWAGVVAWGACLLLWPRLARQQALTVLVIVILGALGIGWVTARGATGLVERGLAQNIPLVAMLIAVSALRLISVGPTAVEHLETGRGALVRTLVGVHLFGLVINFSAVAIFTDRLSARRALSLDQAVGLSQSFIVGALWSPFYGAMALESETGILT